MPWPVRSTQLVLYKAVPAANTNIVVGTVPVGKKWLIKDFSFYSNVGATRTVSLQIGSGANSYILFLGSINAGQLTGSQQRSIVLNAGQTIIITSSTNSEMTVMVSGAQLG